MINFFLNARVHADSVHLDSVLIGPHVNEEEVIANNYKHYSGDQEFQSASQPEINPGNPEPSLSIYLRTTTISHLLGC